MGTPKEKKESKSMDLSAVKEGSEEENTAVKLNKKTGLVANCQNLNIRAEASADAWIVSILRAGAEVVIDDEASTDDFFKVTTGAAVEGYCMKQYISVQE